MPGDRRVLGVNSVYHLVNDGAVQVVVGQIALLAIVFHFGPFETGLLAGTALLVNAIVQVITGVLSDRRDPSKFLPIGIALLGVTTMLVAVSPSFAVLLVVVALARIGASFYHPVGMAWIGRQYPAEELDHAMGFQSGFGDFGEVLGTASAAVLGVAIAWQLPFLLWGAANLAAVAIGLWLVRGHPSPPVTEARPKMADVLRSLRDVRLWLLPLAVGSVSYNVIAFFTPLLFQNVYGLSALDAGLIIAFWLLVGTAVALSFGRLAHRFGRFGLTVYAFVSVGLASLTAAIVRVDWIVLVALWTLGAGLFLTYPALFAFASGASHRRLQGAAFGMVFFFQLFGGAVGAYAGGILSNLFSSDPFLKYAAPFWLSAAVSLATAFYLIALMRRIAPREDSSAGSNAAR